MDEPNILYEDNHVIVVMKPQGVPTCGDESGDDSLLEAVRRYIKVTYDKPGNVYVGLIHRLDRPTGGPRRARRLPAWRRRCGAATSKRST